jgi:hypothetical protein
MVIEQEREQIRKAVRLHTNAFIHTIRLAQASITSPPEVSSDWLAGSISYEVQFNLAGFTLCQDLLTIETDYKFTTKKEDNEQDSIELVSIECRFAAQYGMLGDYRPSDDEIEAFRAGNAVFNCWPYFREFVQNTVVRMNLPPPAIPFLRLVPRPSTGPVPGQEASESTKTTRKKRLARRRPSSKSK